MQKYNNLVEEKLISSSINSENLNENVFFAIDDFDDNNNDDYEEMIVIGEQLDLQHIDVVVVTIQ